jgi:hypothetical protein
MKAFLLIVLTTIALTGCYCGDCEEVTYKYNKTTDVWDVIKREPTSAGCSQTPVYENDSIKVWKECGPK